MSKYWYVRFSNGRDSRWKGFWIEEEAVAFAAKKRLDGSEVGFWTVERDTDPALRTLSPMEEVGLSLVLLPDTTGKGS